MIQDKLWERIRALGFIRVVIRPTKLVESLSVIRARDLVEKASVSLRGWDYPHITLRNDEHGGVEHHAEYIRDWCDWHHHLEFWHMYKSGQFLHYKALREDLSKNASVPEGRVLAVTSFMYSITEIAEFAHRLRAAGLYKEGTTIQITLGNSQNRRLWVEDSMRIDFIRPMITMSDSITVERAFGTSDLLLGDPKDISRSMIVEFFDAFGWAPSHDAIMSTQNELYGLKLGRDR